MAYVMASSGDQSPFGKNPSWTVYWGAARPDPSRVAPIAMKARIVDSLIIESQNSKRPYEPTLRRLMTSSTAPKTTIHTYARTPGNQVYMYVAAAIISVPMASTRPSQYPARAMNPKKELRYRSP